MSELYRIILTASLTILGGILVLVCGQIITKFFIDPIHDLHKVIGEIADALIFYANIYCNPGYGDAEKMEEASITLRQQASRMAAKAHAIPYYKLWQRLGILPAWGDVVEASKNLVGLSNSIRHGNSMENDERRMEIEKRLRIRTDF